jgi:Leucine-rich repeat (LRR) protein
VASYNTIENIVGLETLTALQTLDVAHNQLSSWPPVPINAPISCINLSFNAAIDMIPGETLMALRKTLKEILISNCALKVLPPEVGALGKLRTLNIEYNNLNDIPGSLGHLTELSALVVAGNLIRRKRIEPGSTTSEMKKYLATKDNPHPALIDDLTGGKDFASAALDRQLRDAVHYGTLTLAAKKKDKTKNNGVQENILAEFPVAILEERVAGELTELIVTGNSARIFSCTPLFFVLSFFFAARVNVP